MTSAVFARLKNTVARHVNAAVVAYKISTHRLEPKIEQPKSARIFRVGEREELRKRAKQNESDGDYGSAGLIYAQLGDAGKAYKMRDKCKSAGKNCFVKTINEAIKIYCG